MQALESRLLTVPLLGVPTAAARLGSIRGVYFLGNDACTGQLVLREGSEHVETPPVVPSSLANTRHVLEHYSRSTLRNCMSQEVLGRYVHLVPGKSRFTSGQPFQGTSHGVRIAACVLPGLERGTSLTHLGSRGLVLRGGFDETSSAGNGTTLHTHVHADNRRCASSGFRHLTRESQFQINPTALDVQPGTAWSVVSKQRLDPATVAGVTDVLAPLVEKGDAEAGTHERVILPLLEGRPLTHEGRDRPAVRLVLAGHHPKHAARVLSRKPEALSHFLVPLRLQRGGVSTTREALSLSCHEVAGSGKRFDQGHDILRFQRKPEFLRDRNFHQPLVYHTPLTNMPTMCQSIKEGGHAHSSPD